MKYALSEYRQYNKGNKFLKQKLKIAALLRITS